MILMIKNLLTNNVKSIQDQIKTVLIPRKDKIILTDIKNKQKRRRGRKTGEGRKKLN